jgi:hypothetical protein
MLTLDQTQPVEFVEIVSPSGANAARLQGLTLRLLGESSNTVASATVFNPGSGNNWIYTPPPGTTARAIRIGLENGATNGQGNQIVSLAEVHVHTTSNRALGAESYMTRSHDGVTPAYLANDGIYGSASTASYVSVYWEVDLGQTLALYSVRTVAANGYQQNMTHVTLRLYDENHDSVYSEHHPTNALDVFDIRMPGPVLARYVRVGVENKERTTSGPSWAIGMKEVQVFGRATNEIGILSFTATSTRRC